VRAGYNDLRKLKRALDEIPLKENTQYKIQPDRDRWIVMTSRPLTKDEVEKINKPRDDAIKSLASSQALKTPTSQLRRNRSPMSRTPSNSGVPQASNTRESAVNPGERPRKRPSWATAVKLVTGKTAFERLGLVKWGSLNIQGSKVSRGQRDGGGDETETNPGDKAITT